MRPNPRCPDPECGSESLRVIYAGFPMKLCLKCGTVWGLWSWVFFVFAAPSEEGFAFMVYTGSYLKALWHWLRRDP